jgi:succinoglycan biosynthesis transport protein ExoP
VDLRDYARVLRRRWRLVLVCLLLGIGGAVAYVETATPMYTASTQLYVAAQGGNIQDLQSGVTVGQDQVQSFAQIINSPKFTGPVAAQLSDGLTAKQISDEITATAPLNTALLNVSVNDASPQRAAAIANGVSSYFATYAENLNAGNRLNSPVTVSVVRAADVPGAPSSPDKKLDIALGLIIGLVVGIGGAVLRETLDRSVSSPEQVSELVDLPVVGAIAHDPDASQRPLIVSSDPRSSRAEAFRQLRTNLQFIDVDHRPRSIAVTSSVPSEGKTTTAVNLAITLADAGLNVCLLEGDLRRPKAADYLGLEGAVGVTDVLVGNRTLDEALQEWGQERQLHFLASGPLPPNPSELLASQGMEQLLRELEGRFDLVLIDSPPLLPVTDGALLSTAASGAILIVRHGKTHRDQVVRAVEALRVTDAHIYGAVLTFTPSKGPDSYYYGYGYRYDRKAGRPRTEAPLAPPIPRRLDAPTPNGRHSAERTPRGALTATERLRTGGSLEPHWPEAFYSPFGQGTSEASEPADSSPEEQDDPQQASGTADPERS